MRFLRLILLYEISDISLNPSAIFKLNMQKINIFRIRKLLKERFKKI